MRCSTRTTLGLKTWALNVRKILIRRLLHLLHKDCGGHITNSCVHWNQESCPLLVIRKNPGLRRLDYKPSFLIHNRKKSLLWLSPASIFVLRAWHHTVTSLCTDVLSCCCQVRLFKRGNYLVELSCSDFLSIWISSKKTCCDLIKHP